MSYTVGRVVLPTTPVNIPMPPVKPTAGPRPSEVGLKIIGAIEIGKLELKPGDVLVVKVDRPMSNDATETTRKHLARLLPQGVTIMIIDRGVNLSILTKTEIEERVA